MKRFTSDSVSVSIRPPRTPRWNRLIPDGAARGRFALLVSECIAVALWRNRDTRAGRPLLLRRPTFLGVFATKQFLVQTFRSVPEMPIGQPWQSGLDSLNLGSANDWLLPVPSHSPSSPGGYARSGRRSRRPLSIERFGRHPSKRSGRGLKQAFQGSRFGSSKRYRLLLGERTSQDHGKVVESRSRTSPGQRPLSQFADNGFLEGQLSPV